MMSTQWRSPSDNSLHGFDRLVRQVAHLIERDKSGSEESRNDERLWRLTSIVEFSNDAIISKNLEGIITSWNNSAERIFGYSADEAIGRPITIVIPPNLHDEETAILERIKRGERIENYETVRQRKQGNLIAVSLSIAPIKTAGGQIIGASKIARDITEQKRSEERIATLAHEAQHRTKNILATVQATVNLSHARTSSLSNRVGSEPNFPAWLSRSSRRIFTIPAGQSFKDRQPSWRRQSLKPLPCSCMSSLPMRPSTAHSQWPKAASRSRGRVSRMDVLPCAGSRPEDLRLRLPPARDLAPA
jgi:PAS domain S-box-containing protein